MKYFYAAILGSAFVLAGCGTNVKETLGLDRTAPDEFAIVERAPLTVPPNFNLVPPTPGAQRPQEATTTNAAKGLVLSSQSSAPKANGLSAAERGFLSKANTGAADSNIRHEIDNPAAEKPKTAAEKLGLTSPENRADKALNPVEEAEKLKAQKAQTNAK